MYSADPFMEHAGKYLKYKVEKKAINEVREVRQGDEILRQAKEKEDLLRQLCFSGSTMDELLDRPKEKV